MSVATSSKLNPAFQHSTYIIRKKLLKLLGGAFHIYDANEQIVMYSEMKAFKLKDDITVYTGEDMQTPLLTIKSRNILDFAATFDIVDATTNEKVGAVKKNALKSVLRDEWTIFNAAEQEVGFIREDTLIATLRRFLQHLIPQKLAGEIGGKQVCSFNQHFNIFVHKVTLDFSMDAGNTLDRRIGIAAAILICLQESKRG